MIGVIFTLMYPAAQFFVISFLPWESSSVFFSSSCLHVSVFARWGFMLQLMKQWWTLFTDGGFQKCSTARAVIPVTESCLFLMQRCLRAWRSQSFSFGFSLLLFHTEFSLDYRTMFISQLFLINLISSEMFHQCFVFFSISQLFKILAFPLWTFLECDVDIKLKMRLYFSKNKKTICWFN